ncbi:MAG: glycosyl hydrolase, partial [Bacteroidota bacterium]|nr:glycosyl hydrolase [Bacteroidota bacterium]
WTAIQNNLPERGTVYCMAEDPKNENLLFAGTEFGVFFSIDGGAKWIQMKGGLPPIAIKDMEIQKRDNDLVVATFGRGYYVLDDYTSLRTMAKQDLDKAAFIAPPRKAWMYMESYPLGLRDKGFQGESYWNSPNPKVGSMFTYYLKEDIKTIKEKRQESEKAKNKANLPPYYPSLDSLRIEDAEPEPYLLFTISDENGNAVRHLTASAKKGIHRIVWDFRTDAKDAIEFKPFNEENVFGSPDRGIFVIPGNYTVSLSKYEDGNYTSLTSPQPFTIEALNMASMPASDKNVLYAFGKKASELYRAVDGTNAYRAELVNKLKYIKEAILKTPSVDKSVMENIFALDKRLIEVDKNLNGDVTLLKREFDAPPSIRGRVSSIMNGMLSTTAGATNTFINSYTDAAKEFEPVLQEVKAIDTDVKKLDSLLEKNHAPYTPGRLPDWKME